MPQPISVDFEHGEHRFAFQIHQRELLFGRAGKGQYYWMDGRQLRRGRGGPNFRPCVDLWWHAVQQHGAEREPDNEVSLVLAECYPLVNTARALQDIYIDAHLHRTADREYVIEDEEGVRRVRSDRTYLLPEKECKRLRGVARSRDVNRIRGELEDLFLGSSEIRVPRTHAVGVPVPLLCSMINGSLGHIGSCGGPATEKRHRYFVEENAKYPSDG